MKDMKGAIVVAIFVVVVMMIFGDRGTDHTYLTNPKTPLEEFLGKAIQDTGMGNVGTYGTWSKITSYSVDLSLPDTSHEKLINWDSDKNYLDRELYVFGYEHWSNFKQMDREIVLEGLGYLDSVGDAYVDGYSYLLQNNLLPVKVDENVTVGYADFDLIESSLDEVPPELIRTGREFNSRNEYPVIYVKGDLKGSIILSKDKHGNTTKKKDFIYTYYDFVFVSNGKFYSYQAYKAHKFIEALYSLDISNIDDDFLMRRNERAEVLKKNVIREVEEHLQEIIQTE